ncbi:unnamed protein product, partial [Discosporangium mesarthrocarpum]
GERWPTWDSAPMVAILTIDSHALPYVPPYLQAARHHVFFVQQEPKLSSMTDDGSLVHRTYNDGVDLLPLEPPPGLDSNPLGLAFERVVDFPSVESVEAQFGRKSECSTLYRTMFESEPAEFVCHDGIKLGGYPLLIRATAFLIPLDSPYEVQIDSTDSFMWADTGIAYLG